MYGAEETVLEEGHHVCLGSFLEGHEGGGLEPHVAGTHLRRDREVFWVLSAFIINSLTLAQISRITREKGSFGISKLVDF